MMSGKLRATLSLVALPVWGNTGDYLMTMINEQDRVYELARKAENWKVFNKKCYTHFVKRFHEETVPALAQVGFVRGVFPTSIFGKSPQYDYHVFEFLGRPEPDILEVLKIYVKFGPVSLDIRFNRIKVLDEDWSVSDLSGREGTPLGVAPVGLTTVYLFDPKKRFFIFPQVFKIKWNGRPDSMATAVDLFLARVNRFLVDTPAMRREWEKENTLRKQAAPCAIWIDSLPQAKRNS